MSGRGHWQSNRPANSSPYLTVPEAWAVFAQRVKPLTEVEWQALAGLPGRTLALPVTARSALPRFDRAAMDGYAVRAQDLPGRLAVIATGAAGEPPATVGPGQAARVLTGAPLPVGADTVVEQEQVTVEDSAVGRFVTVAQAYGPGRNIARRGGEVAPGTTVLEAGQRLTAVDVGLLAGIGELGAWVVRRPQVLLAVTGDEVVPSGLSGIGRAQIFDSNGPLLRALLEQAGAVPIGPFYVPDRPRALAHLFNQARRIPVDLVLTTGGVSVGDRDWMVHVVERMGEVWFWRLDMHPGKAVAAGAVGGRPVLALSGNPAAALMGFTLLAVPLLARLQGGQARPHSVWGRLRHPFPKPTRETRYLRVRIESDPGGLWFDWSLDQSSDVLRSWSAADALAIVPRGSGPLPAETPLEAWLLPKGLGRGGVE
ncbi:MAG: molybdopterin molybdotransferase MoeA [Firmicutes bacterium]|nr:molybdopterin molybdotransferase MoeA [Alicyclobacillaceae bacterium]MCL6496347.1 molybdopterin molybdotransferase MoeA [Bacillota bacterium]